MKMKKSKAFLYAGHVWCLNGVLIFGLGVIAQLPDPFVIACGLASVGFGVFSIWTSLRLAQEGE